MTLTKALNDHLESAILIKFHSKRTNDHLNFALQSYKRAKVKATSIIKNC